MTISYIIYFTLVVLDPNFISTLTTYFLCQSVNHSLTERKKNTPDYELMSDDRLKDEYSVNHRLHRRKLELR